MKRVVIFDVDGTLLKLRKEESDAYVQAFETCYGITGIDDDWNNYRLHSDEGIAIEILEGHFGRECRPEEVRRVKEVFTERLLEIATEVIPGTKAVMAALDESGNTGLALSTGNWESIAKLRLEKADIGKYFRCGGFGEDGYGKTAILGEALNRCQRLWPGLIRGRDIIYAGDRPADAEAAHAHGVPFIGINPDREIFRGLDVEHIFPDYRDFEGFMRAVEKCWRQG